MSNAKQSYPSLQIQCSDRVRTFCLNLGAFRAMEEYLSTKNNNPDYSILDDFDWTSNKIEHLSLVMFGGLYTDSLTDPEPFTVAKAEAIVSLIGIAEVRACVEESLSRTLTQKQSDKFREDAEKKRLAKKKTKRIGTR
jgi:hypothetical protein